MEAPNNSFLSSIRQDFNSWCQFPPWFAIGSGESSLSVPPRPEPTPEAFLTHKIEETKAHRENFPIERNPICDSWAEWQQYIDDTDTEEQVKKFRKCLEPEDSHQTNWRLLRPVVYNIEQQETLNKKCESPLPCSDDIGNLFPVEKEFLEYLVKAAFESKITTTPYLAYSEICEKLGKSTPGSLRKIANKLKNKGFLKIGERHLKRDGNKKLVRWEIPESIYSAVVLNKFLKSPLPKSVTSGPSSSYHGVSLKKIIQRLQKCPNMTALGFCEKEVRQVVKFKKLKFWKTKDFIETMDYIENQLVIGVNARDYKKVIFGMFNNGPHKPWD